MGSAYEVLKWAFEPKNHGAQYIYSIDILRDLDNPGLLRHRLLSLSHRRPAAWLPLLPARRA
uniref:Uncharacterized protein n=1 Tax=Rhizophora mucronata TaxID=61149 RepID=A0A2P2L9D3_RHIMU